MNDGIQVAKIWNIPIRLHISWFIIFALVAWTLASGYFPAQAPDLSKAQYLVVGALTSLLFGASVLAHELGHSFVALRNKVRVSRVTLFIFGGIAQIEEEPPTPRAEFWIAIAGPLTSLALGLGFGALGLLAGPLAWLSAPSLWLARINLVLAAFNLIPGFPLDGGRVLRAIVWQVKKDLKKATQIASTAGRVVAIGFIAYGVFIALTGDFFNGLWIAFIGWFLQNAAAGAVTQMEVQETLKGVEVSQIMQRDVQSIPWSTRLDSVVEERVIPFGSQVFLVTDQHGLALRGMLTLGNVTAVPRDRWAHLTAQDVMVPRNRFVSVRPEMEVLDALRFMDESHVSQVPVMDDDDLIGVLTQEDVMRYLRLWSKLKH